jgi:bifunctional DNA-binding transcriptional regulator/antitoxin component of YhaV-PrlF toxin-antitoxin module
MRTKGKDGHWRHGSARPTKDNANALTQARQMHYHSCVRPSTPEITMPATLEAESTLTDRDQTTVPETVRRALRLRKRDKIQYVIRPSGEVVLTRASDAEADDPVILTARIQKAGEKVPANNVKELVALMKAKPEDFKYASSGVGSTQHIAGEGFDIAAGVKSVHVPYKGSAQAHLDIIAGNVQIMFDTTSSAMGQIKAGKFKPLAVTTAQRSSELPNVPTLAEAGVTGFEMSTWYGVFVTTGTPPDVVSKLQTELARIIKLPDVQAKLKSLGGEPGNISPEEFSKINKQDFEKFGKLIKQANIKM